MTINGLIILIFNSIPLVYSNNNTLTIIVSNTANLSILLCNSFGCVNYTNNNIGTFYRSYRTNNTEFLNFFFNFALTAKSCSINKNVFFFIISYRFGVTYLSITTFRYGMTLFQAQQKLNGNRAAVLGYGAAINLVYLIPGAVFFLLPGIITGGVMLARDLKILNVNAR